MITRITPSQSRFSQRLPLYLSSIPAGFPSPADDYLEKRIDLNEHLIRHPSATFFVKVSGDSMINAGIFSGDTLVIDRSLRPANQDIVLAILDGEFTVKRFQRRLNCVYLIPENPAFSPIEVQDDQDFEIWGVVIHVIRSYRTQ